MATSAPESRRLSPRHALLLVGVVALLLVPTGAFVVNQGVFDAVGPNEEIVLQPYDGPNGEYAAIDSNEELTVNVTEAGANLDATTDIERVFTITNEGNDSKQVWLTHTAERSVTFYADRTERTISQSENVTLGPGERVIVSIRVDTVGGDAEVNQRLVTTILVHSRTVAATPRLAVDDAVAFGNHTPGASATETLVLSNAGSAPLRVDAVDLQGADASQFEFAAAWSPAVLAPGAERRVQVTYRPTAAGRHAASVAISSNSTTGRTTSVSLTGRATRAAGGGGQSDGPGRSTSDGSGPGAAPGGGDANGSGTFVDDDTEITFLGGPDANDSSTDLQEAVSVSNLSVAAPDPDDRDGPRAAIRTDEGVGDTDAVDVDASGVSLEVAREDRVVERIDARGADALTLVRQPIALTGSHSLFLSKDAIDDNWRMIRRVEITVPPEYENRSARLRMRIPRQKFGETAAENATIARQHDGWQLLDTTVVERTPTHVVLQARTPGFSTFAVYADNSVSYEWTVETYDEPFHESRIEPQFDEVGVYNVSLTVTDSFGLTDSADYRVISNDVPEVTIEARGPVVPNESVLLEATVEDDLGNRTLNWTLPDGSTATGQRVSYSFEAGVHDVGVAVTDEFGATGTAEETFRVGSGPSLAIELRSVTVPLGWPLLVLALLLVPVLVALRRGLPVPDHPPAVELFAEPWFDVDDQAVIVPRLRVVDPAGDLDRIAVTVRDYDGRTVAAASAALDDGREYDGTGIWLAVEPDERLERGSSYAVEVLVTDDAGEETVTARSARVNRFVYPLSELDWSEEADASLR